jgi:hypothetical protein
MITRRPSKQTRHPRSKKSGNHTISLTVFDEHAEELEELAGKQGVSVDTLMVEAVAMLFRKHGKSLPLDTIEFLETNGRRIPAPVRQKTKNELN